MHSTAHIDAEQVKRAAVGRELELLEYVAHIDRDLLDGKPHPCPRPGCGGKDRFRLIDPKAGAVFCNQCFNAKNGDFLAAIQHFRGISFPQALEESAYRLGIVPALGGNGNGKAGQGNGRPDVDPLVRMAELKRCPVESLKVYGAKSDAKKKCVTFPMYDETLKQCSTFMVWPDSKDEKFRKGLNEKGKHAGLFFPHEAGNVRLPQAAETWLTAEGVKDPAALHGLGYPNVCGLNTSSLSQKFAKLFAGVHIVVIPDPDEAGDKGAPKTVKNLQGVAASVKVAKLPVRSKDVRDHLALDGGEQMVRDAIEQAASASEGTAESGDPGRVHTVTSAEKGEGRQPQDESAAAGNSRFPLTDTGLAERFARQHGSTARYNHVFGKWHVWDGRRLREDDTGAVDQLAKQTVRSIFREAADEPDDDRRKHLTDFARKSESAQRRAAMLTLAKSEPPIPIRPDELDQDGWLLNCLNGTLDLRTGQLREHRLSDRITKLCPVEYLPNATAPMWDDFLRRIFDCNQALIGFIQRLLGYCLTGATSEQVLPIFHGIGSNGKSTAVNLVLDMLGDDYSMKAPPDMLLARKHDAHPTERADLFGKRFVAAVETDDGRRLAESLVKELTGGDRVRARRMREDFWQFRPTHKVILACNHKPEVRGTDHAIWRRLRLVPFNVVIPERSRDKFFGDKLRAELPGVLAWCVRGCRDWQAQGLGVPPEVESATESYRADEDAIGAFIDACCITGAAFRVRAGALYDAYRDYCDKGGEYALSQKRFGQRLTDRGIQRTTNNGVWYAGLGLVDLKD